MATHTQWPHTPKPAVLSGCVPTPPFHDAIAAAIAGLAGRPAKITELYAAAAKIEAAYAQAGHVLTRVTIPPQRIRDGERFHMLVVDGFIESIDDTAVPAQVRSAVRKRAAALLGQPGLTLAEIERRVLLAGEVPGITLRSAIVRGTAVGGARLVLTADWDPLTVTLGGENNVGAAYGSLAFSTQVSFNNVLGRGELVYLQATSGRDLGALFGNQPRRRVLGIGAVAPLDANGLTFNPEYIRVDTNPITQPGAFEVRGRFERMAFRLQYPLVHTRARSIDLTGSLDFISERSLITAFGIALSEDRLRVANVGVKWSERQNSGTAFFGEFQFSQGLAGLGARSAADVAATGTPFGRFGSRPDFSKLSVRLRIDRQLAGGFLLGMTVRGQQTLSGALPSAAQFALDGDDGLSGFVQGSLGVDSGLSTRGEVSRPLAFGAKRSLSVTPYGFAAIANGWISEPTALEQNSRRGWSAGAGARFVLAGSHSGRASYGAVEVSRNHDPSVPRDTTRFTASLTFRL